MHVPKWLCWTKALACALLMAALASSIPARQEAPAHPGGDSVAVTLVDGVPFAIDETGAMVNLDDEAVAALDSDVRAIVETDDGDAFLMFGGATVVEQVMAAAVGVLPIATTAPTTTGTADAHPKQPVIVFEIEKKWTDEKGQPRVRKAKLEVEKRPGESTPEHIDRAERELEGWEKKGWKTT